MQVAHHHPGESRGNNEPSALGVTIGWRKGVATLLARTQS